MKVRTQTRLVRRGPVYYFRVRIPEDFTPEQRQQLISEWHQKPARVRLARNGSMIVAQEIVQSLKTKDKKAAESQVRIKSVELDTLLEKLRNGHASAPRTTIRANTATGHRKAEARAA
jgi:hypothetical protein